MRWPFMLRSTHEREIRQQEGAERVRASIYEPTWYVKQVLPQVDGSIRMHLMHKQGRRARAVVFPSTACVVPTEWKGVLMAPGPDANGRVVREATTLEELLPEHYDKLDEQLKSREAEQEVPSA
jgi:hypothetical protein